MILQICIIISEIDKMFKMILQICITILQINQIEVYAEVPLVNSLDSHGDVHESLILSRIQSK
jgi:hypothetical protein